MEYIFRYSGLVGIQKIHEEFEKTQRVLNLSGIDALLPWMQATESLNFVIN